MTATEERAVQPSPAGDGAPPPRPGRRGGSRARLWDRRGRGALAVLAVGVFVLSPVVLLVVSSFNTALPGDPATYGLDNWRTAFTDSELRDPVWNTLTLGVTRTLIGTVVAVALAWLIARTDMPGGRALEFVMWLAFFIPALSLTLGWKVLLDPDYGLVNNWLRALPGLQDATSGPLNINSFWGIIWVHLTASTIPFQVVMITPAFRRMSATLEEAARMCGAGRLATIRKVLIPIMLPAILGAAMLSFIWSLKAFEVELLLGTPVGIDVYSTKIYEWVRDAPPQYGIATALGSVFIVVMVAMALGHRLLIRGKDYTTITAHTFSDAPTRLGRFGRTLAAVLCWSFVAIAVVLPVGAVILGSMMRRFGFFNVRQPFTLSHWEGLLNDSLFGSALANTLLLGVGATVVGVLGYFAVARITSRSDLPGRGAVALLAWFPVAVPGILLGLGFLWVYLSTPFGTVLYGTLAGLILALVIGHMSTGTQQLNGALLQVSRDHEMAARVCGAGRLRTYRRILLPLIGPSVAAAAILTFASAARDVSTVVLLSGPESRPLSVLMLEYSMGGEAERGAALGVLLSALMAIVALIARRLAGSTVGAPRRARPWNRRGAGPPPGPDPTADEAQRQPVSVPAEREAVSDRP